jgi:curved DNA-binding protein CbpA
MKFFLFGCLTLALALVGVVHGDHYSTLGVRRGANKDEIRTAYRALIRKWHPDKHADAPDAAQARSVKLNEAYSVLSDDAARREYDLSQSGYGGHAGHGQRHHGNHHHHHYQHQRAHYHFRQRVRRGLCVFFFFFFSRHFRFRWHTDANLVFSYQPSRRRRRSRV